MMGGMEEGLGGKREDKVGKGRWEGEEEEEDESNGLGWFLCGGETESHLP